jgi:RNA polymerase sigma-70 factor (ECF subfamily)
LRCLVAASKIKSVFGFARFAPCPSRVSLFDRAIAHAEVASVVLSQLDRNLLERCLGRKPRAWEDFVDRFVGLVAHVVRHTAQARSIQLTPQDTEDLVAEVFVTIVKDDFAVLRRFRGESSLATYLTVVARRVVVGELLKRRTHARLDPADTAATNPAAGPEARIADRDQVERLLASLHGPEADVIRMYHLEGKSYQEISSSTGMPENSVGPTLSRARQKLRQAGVDAGRD